MEFIDWANGEGVTIKIFWRDASKLIDLLEDRVKRIEIDGLKYEVEFTQS